MSNEHDDTPANAGDTMGVVAKNLATIFCGITEMPLVFVFTFPLFVVILFMMFGWWSLMMGIGLFALTGYLLGTKADRDFAELLEQIP